MKMSIIIISLYEYSGIGSLLKIFKRLKMTRKTNIVIRRYALWLLINVDEYDRRGKKKLVNILCSFYGVVIISFHRVDRKNEINDLAPFSYRMLRLRKLRVEFPRFHLLFLWKQLKFSTPNIDDQGFIIFSHALSKCSSLKSLEARIVK